MKILIGIPARYASTRLPAKPLLKISGKEMLLRVWGIAQKVANNYPEGEVLCAVATEDQRIVDFCTDATLPQKTAKQGQIVLQNL